MTTPDRAPLSAGKKVWAPYARFLPAWWPHLLPICPPDGPLDPAAGLVPGISPAVYDGNLAAWTRYDFNETTFGLGDWTSWADRWPSDGNVAILLGVPPLYLFAFPMHLQDSETAGRVVKAILATGHLIPLLHTGPESQVAVFRAPLWAADGLDGSAAQVLVIGGKTASGYGYNWQRSADMRCMDPDLIAFASSKVIPVF